MKFYKVIDVVVTVELAMKPYVNYFHSIGNKFSDHRSEWMYHLKSSKFTFAQTGLEMQAGMLEDRGNAGINRNRSRT